MNAVGSMQQVKGATTPAVAPAVAPQPSASKFAAQQPLRAAVQSTMMQARPAVAPAQAAEGAESLVVPEWVKDAVFYQVFPDRFANGDMGNDPRATDPWGSPPQNDIMMGGDLQGLTQKLDYLKKLGVNALYLNPVFEAPSNHKYNTTSYDRVDADFGGNAAFHEMVDKAHANGVKVMIDGVFNHVSHQHDWFKDVREKGPKSEYWDRFDVKNWPIRYERDAEGVLRSPDYRSWWNYATLPELRNDHPEVRKHLLTGPDAVVKKWIRDGKIDGWRMDVADEVEPEFWREARKQIKATNPDTYILAENWHDATSMLQGDQFDGAMNYRFFQQPAVEFFGRKQLSSDQFVQRLQNPYSPEARLGMFNILDSHDTPRFITEAGGDWYRQRPAAIFQMTYVGAPVVYYGDEIGTEGGKDPDSRRAFDWSLVPKGALARGSRPGAALDAARAGTELSKAARAEQLLGLYQKLIATRKAEPALRRGEFSVLATHNDDSTLVYRRHVEGTARDAVVALNNNVVDKDIRVPLAQVAEDGTRFTDALSGRTFTVQNGEILLEDVDGNYGAVLLRDA